MSLISDKDMRQLSGMILRAKTGERYRIHNACRDKKIARFWLRRADSRTHWSARIAYNSDTKKWFGARVGTLAPGVLQRLEDEVSSPNRGDGTQTNAKNGEMK